MSNYTELGGGNTARLYFNIGNVEIKTYNETLREQARINASVITNLSNKPQFSKSKIDFGLYLSPSNKILHETLFYGNVKHKTISAL